VATPLSLDRRSMLALSMVSGALVAAPALAAGGWSIRAIAFDAFAVFDHRAITAAVVATVGERGAALTGAWLGRIFTLSWLETAAGRYSGFAALADVALAQSAAPLGIDMRPTQRRDIAAVFEALPAWPDAGTVFEALRSAGVRLAFLSNLGDTVLAANMRRNHLDSLMERPLSTDRVRAFKPSPRAYAMGTHHFALPPEEIGFAAFGGWDALGAKWFGYPTAWINRQNAAAEALGPEPNITGRDLSAVLRLASIDI